MTCFICILEKYSKRTQLCALKLLSRNVFYVKIRTPLFSLFSFFLDTGSHCVTLTTSLLFRPGWFQRFACLCLQSAGIKAICSHDQLSLYFQSEQFKNYTNKVLKFIDRVNILNPRESQATHVYVSTFVLISS